MLIYNKNKVCEKIIKLLNDKKEYGYKFDEKPLTLKYGWCPTKSVLLQNDEATENDEYTQSMIWCPIMYFDGDKTDQPQLEVFASDGVRKFSSLFVYVGSSDSKITDPVLIDMEILNVELTKFY